MNKNTRIKNNISMFNIINYMVLIAVSIITLYPMFNLLVVSISPIEHVMKGGVFLLPKGISLEAYKYTFSQSGIIRSYAVTTYVTVFGTIMNLSMTIAGAYVLSKKYLPGRKYLMTFVILTMIFNGGLIPTYLVVRSMAMVNTLWSIMIPNVINTFFLIILRNFFQTIPLSLEESAKIDGCSDYRILFQIILPLSKAALATIALFYAVTHWNEYFYAIVYINNQKLMPLQVLIRTMYQSGTDMFIFENSPPPVETIKTATIVVATVPILCVYPFAQKYFVKGVMVGHVKG